MRIGDMAVGSLLQLKVQGEPRNFRVMHHGKPSEMYDDSWLGGTILMLDWSEATYYQNINSSSQSNKRNYAVSAAHSWLNETWLGYLDQELRDAVMEVKVPYRTDIKGGPYEIAAGADGLAAKVWLPAAVEVARGSAYETDQSTFYVEEGATFDFWKGAGAAQYADWACFDADGADGGWGTRTMNKHYYGTGSLFYNWVGQDGMVIAGTKQKGNLRPCLVLPDELLVAGGSVTSAVNFPVKTGGVWRDGTASVKTGGVWHPVAVPMAKIDGAWRE